MEKVKFISIDVVARDKMGITNDMYAIADSVYHLARGYNNPVPGWCDASKVYLGKHAGVSRATTFRHLSKLVDKKILERDGNGLYRTAEKWYKMVIVAREYREKVKKEVKQVVGK